MKKLNNIKKEKELSDMSQMEAKELEIVKTKSFLMQFFYASYKSSNDLKIQIQHLMEAGFSLLLTPSLFCVCIFAMYFIIGFGIRYGPETAELWLLQFVSSILTTFIICDPLVIFVKCAIIPTAVHKFVLSHPDLLSVGTASAGAPAFMGASIGILGATGQAAIALGMGAAAAIGGAAGAAASRWRKKDYLKLMKMVSMHPTTHMRSII